MRISLITLGCSKNTVDSEKLAAEFYNKGFDVVFEDFTRSDIALINTCGFILDSQEESINTILQLALAKKDRRRRLKKVYVFGCLVERFKDDLIASIPEVDAWFGVREPERIVDTVSRAALMEKTCHDTLRILSTPPHYAYLKISEGCDKKCAFCSIPLIRGDHISRTKEDIIREAKYLYSIGVKELMLISQDLTYYGADLYKSLELPDLVSRVCNIGFDWVRLHYAHPNQVTDEVIEMYNKLPNLCKYLDIPLQHVSTPILKAMGRNINQDKTVSLVKKIRDRVPNIAIRTTFIVGYPNESEKQFQELYDFIEEVKFDRLGVFTFSPEEGTRAYNITDNVPPEVKEQRKEEIMLMQQNISLERNQSFIGKNLNVIIDNLEGEYYIGRTEYDSPEVDNEVLISSDADIKIGEFAKVEIVDADFFDLYAKCL